MHLLLTTGRWRHHRRRCSPSCLPSAWGQTCPGWCWRENHHLGGNTGAELSGRWSISSAAPAHHLYHPIKQDVNKAFDSFDQYSHKFDFRTAAVSQLYFRGRHWECTCSGKGYWVTVIVAILFKGNLNEVINTKRQDFNVFEQWNPCGPAMCGAFKHN